MLPIGKTGFVKEGRYKGWWIKVQEEDQPQGYLVSRSLDPHMRHTRVFDGILPDLETLERHFEGLVVEWSAEA